MTTKMNTLPIIEESNSLYVNRNELSILKEKSEENVVSFYKNSVKYENLPLQEKWKYRRAVNDLQVLINKIQRDGLSEVEEFDYNLPEVVNLLKIRKEMLSAK